MAWDIATDEQNEPDEREVALGSASPQLSDHGSQPRRCTEHSFRSWDGSELFYRQWPAQRGLPAMPSF